jgi:DNA ligase (NAD+)
MDKLIQKISKLKTTEKLQEYLDSQDINQIILLDEYLRDKYYNEGIQVIPDTQYDLIKETLKSRNPDWQEPIGAKIQEGDNRVKLPFWLGSMDKIKQEEDAKIKNWITKNKIVDQANKYIVSSKLDGVSCLAVFDNEKINLYTRGDGTTGSDISHLKKYIKTIPNELNVEKLAVRGELIIPEKVFEKKYSKLYQNPRNMIAGLIGSKTAREGLSDIHFVVYEIVGETKMQSPESQLKILKENKFEVVNHTFTNEIDSNILTNFLVKMKKDSKYELDGIIIQTNVEYTRNKDKNPKYAFAFKVQGDSIDTTVINVEWNVSQWGALKPIVNIKPVKLSGVTISKATGYNGRFIVDNKIGPGAIVTIIRSGDVIPKIINVVKISDSGEPDLPNIQYKWTDTHVDLIASGEDEEGNDDISNKMCVKRITRFFEKLNIKEIGKSRVQKLFDNGIDTLIKIISCSKQELITGLDSEKLGEKIYENIKTALTNIKPADLLGATGVFGEGMGQRKLEALFEEIPDILSMDSDSQLKDLVMKTPGFSDISADLVIDNLKYAISFMDSIKPYITNKQKKDIESESDLDSNIEQTLSKKIFVVSGFRDNGELKTEIEKRGGKLIDTWKADASGVIVGKKAVGQETGKVKKALDKGIKVYTVDEFRAEFF